MSGDTWIARALRSSNKFVKTWSIIILKAAFFVIVLSLSLISMCEQNICHQPTLKPLDIQKISSQSTKTSSNNTDNTKTKEKESTPVPVVVPTVIAKPIRMLFPTIDLGVDIADATINAPTNYWPLSDTAAQYANFTPGLGSKKGTMVIYGHNTGAVMRKTADLQIGDALVLIDDKNQTWNFTFVKEENVVPENVGFIYEDVPFRIVMFTCTGWNDQYRRLMYFAPV